MIFFESRKETEKLERKLAREIKARKDLEKKIAEENAKKWQDLYFREKEKAEEYYKKFEKMSEQNDKLKEGIKKEKTKLKKKQKK